MSDPAEDLYECCSKIARKATEGFHKKRFKQDELLSLCGDESESPVLKSVKDISKLMPIIQQLSRVSLFCALKSGSGFVWGLRPRKVAKIVKSLDTNEKMVFEAVEAAYEEGTWVRNIKVKTGIRDENSANKVLRRLITLNLIKNVQSVKNGAQKTYMLAYLTPSDEVTGGSFYDNGDLDDSMVDNISNLIVHHVRQASWKFAEKPRKQKREASPIDFTDGGLDGLANSEARGRKKRKSGSGTAVRPHDIEDSASHHKEKTFHPVQNPETDPAWNQLSLPAGSQYPDAESIHEYLINSDILRAGKANGLTVEEIQHLLEVLVWDGKLEVIGGGYRSVRGVKPNKPGEQQAEEDIRGNGLTEAPCGRCPVFDVCGNGGPINAASCVYFTEWLGQSAA